MSSPHRFLPSEHQRERELSAEEQRLLEARQKEEAQALRRAVDKVLDSEDGRILWRWLHGRCGWAKSSLISFAQGDVAPLKTECLAAVRNVYMDLRALASPDLRVAAEDFAENGNVPNKDKGEK